MTQAINITNPGIYSVVITFVGGCSASANITINPAETNASITVFEQSGPIPNDGQMCGPDYANLLANYGLSYIWNAFGNTSQAIENMSNAQNLTFSQTLCVDITGVSGCVGVNSTACVTINYLPAPIINVTASANNFICSGSPIILTATGGSNYSWNPGNLVGNPVTVFPYATTTYVATATDPNGCTGSSQITIPGPNYSAPYGIQITGNVTWTQPISRVDGLLYVTAGAHLTISGSARVEFSHHPDPLDPMPLGVARLIVLPGGSLTVDPGAVLSGCGGGTWDGIELWGTGIFNNSAAVANINGRIENADIGIYTSRRPKKNQSIVNNYGGTFVANGAQFVNNRVSVYMPRSVNSSVCTMNCCSFSFDGTSPYFADYNLANNIEAIHIDAGNNVHFTANSNTFTGGLSAYSPELRGTAIKCKDCFGTITGNNTFTGHARAIGAEYFITSNQLIVNGANLSDNQEGIYMQGSSLAAINNITFQVPPPLSPFTKSYGLFAVASNGFDISDNIVNPLISDNNSYGMVFENTGIQGGVVSKNTFNDVGIGIQAQKDNQNLKLSCNNFNNPANLSIAVVNVPTFPTSLMKRQGLNCNANGNPAGNEWPYSCNASTSDVNIFAGTAVSFDYYSYKANLSGQSYTKPLCSSSSWELAHMLPNICISLPDKDINSCGSVFPLPPRPPLTTFTTYYNSIKNLIGIYQNKIFVLTPKLKTALAAQDGGSTQNLINIINQTPKKSASQLKNILNSSNSLSDAVLIAVINRNPGLPPGILAAILASQIPLSVNVLTALENLGLPNGIKNQIYAAQSNTPLYEKATAIEGEIQNLKGDIILLENEFQRTKINETTKISREDSKLFGDVASKILLTQDYASKSETDSIRIILTDLQTDSSMDVTEKQNFVSYMSTIADILDDNQTIYTADNSQMTNIQSVSNSNTKAGVHANGVLKERKQVHYSYFIADIPVTNNQRLTYHSIDDEEKVQLANSGSFKLSPNPNNGSFKIQLDLINIPGSNLIINITNLLGQIVLNKTIMITGDSNIIDIQDEKLYNGIYIVTLLHDNKTIGQSKLVIE